MKAWSPPIAEPIRCHECKAPLAEDEVEFYGTLCERCEAALDQRMRDDVREGE